MLASCKDRNCTVGFNYFKSQCQGNILCVCVYVCACAHGCVLCVGLFFCVYTTHMISILSLLIPL